MCRVSGSATPSPMRPGAVTWRAGRAISRLAASRPSSRSAASRRAGGALVSARSVRRVGARVESRAGTSRSKTSDVRYPAARFRRAIEIENIPRVSPCVCTSTNPTARHHASSVAVDRSRMRHGVPSRWVSSGAMWPTGDGVAGRSAPAGRRTVSECAWPRAKPGSPRSSSKISYRPATTTTSAGGICQGCGSSASWLQIRDVVEPRSAASARPCASASGSKSRHSIRRSCRRALRPGRAGTVPGRRHVDDPRRQARARRASTIAVRVRTRFARRSRMPRQPTLSR